MYVNQQLIMQNIIKRGWSNKYKNEDLDKLLSIANSYFIPSKNGKNYKYIGPKNEYQKWYFIRNRDKKKAYKNEWLKNNKELDLSKNYLLL